MRHYIECARLKAASEFPPRAAPCTCAKIRGSATSKMFQATKGRQAMKDKEPQIVKLERQVRALQQAISEISSASCCGGLVDLDLAIVAARKLLPKAGKP